MRESARIEQAHLPIDVYEEWLKFQKVKHRGVRHQSRVPDEPYEAWIGKAVERRLQRASRAAKPHVVAA